MMYTNDPVYWQQQTPVKPVRLWPYVLAGMVVAALLLASLDPIPEHTHPEPMVYQVP